MAAALMTGISGIRRRLSVIPPFLDKGSSTNNTGKTIVCFFFDLLSIDSIKRKIDKRENYMSVI